MTNAEFFNIEYKTLKEYAELCIVRTPFGGGLNTGQFYYLIEKKANQHLYKDFIIQLDMFNNCFRIINKK